MGFLVVLVVLVVFIVLLVFYKGLGEKPRSAATFEPFQGLAAALQH